MVLASLDSLSVRLKLAGTLVVRAVLTVNGSAYNSQGLLEVGPGPVDWKRMQLYGPALAGVVAGHPAALFVQLADSWGNAVVRSPTPCWLICFSALRPALCSGTISWSTAPALHCQLALPGFVAYGGSGSLAYLLRN